MAKFYSSIYGISCVAAVISAASVVFMVSIIALEIILRAVFSTSTFMTGELVGYAMMICVMWSLGYVLESGHLIRVHLILTHVSTRISNLMTCASAFVVCTGAVWLAMIFWSRAARGWQRGTVSSSIAAIPTWIPEGILTVGLGIFALQAFAYGLRHITGHPSPSTPDPEDMTE